MAAGPNATGFEARVREPERRAFFDLMRRVAALEAGGGSGGGGGEEVFIGPSDPGTPYELWYDTDATPGGWTSVSVISPWTSGNFQYRMVGDMVQLKGRGTNGSASAVTNTSPLLTLPAGFRPPANVSIPLPRTSPVQDVVFDIWVFEASTGNLRLASGGSFPAGGVVFADYVVQFYGGT